MTNITYVYSGNRKNRYYQKKFEAREFFYGLNLFDNDNNFHQNAKFYVYISSDLKLI